MLIVDGNRQSEVVSLCLTSLETKEITSKMVAAIVIQLRQIIPVGHRQVL